MTIGTGEQVTSNLPPRQQQQKQVHHKSDNGSGDETTASGSNFAKCKLPQRQVLATAPATVEAPNDGNNSTTVVVYDVEHLATFSTTSSSTTSSHDKSSKNKGSLYNSTTSHQDKSDKSSSSTSDVDVVIVHEDDNLNEGQETRHKQEVGEPKEALQRLFELEKLSGIWTQRMQIELRNDYMLIIDCESDSIVERFEKDCVTKPEASSQYNDIYNNIVVFTIQQRSSSSTSTSDISNKQQHPIPTRSELHIFQCVSHNAQQLVSDILSWKSSNSRINNDSNKKIIMKSNEKEKPATTRIGTTLSNDSNQPIASLTSSSKSVLNDNGKTNGQNDFLNTKEPQQKQETEANRETKTETSTSGQSVTQGSPITTTTPTTTTTTTTQKPVVMVASCPNASENVPIVNVNVKETVQVFNQIAALREKSSKPNSPTNRPLSDGSAAGATTTNLTLTDTNDSGSNLYKQRSIRAILAPKFSSSSGGLSPKDSQPIQRQLNQQTSSSSMNLASNEQQRSVHQSSKSNHQQPHSTSESLNNGSADHLLMKFQNTSNSQIGANSLSQSSSSTSSSSSHHQLQQQQSSKTVSKHKVSMPSNSQQQVLQSSRHHHHQQHNNHQAASQKSQSDSSRSHVSSASSAGSSGQMAVDQVTSNESYVSVLNHCFDDIEKFIIRIQHAAAASRELQAKRKLSKRSLASGGQLIGGKDPQHQQVTASELAILSARARGPNDEDYFEILSKFKLAFNLLAKLKGCIHEPNAPELVHFLFTPLAIIIDSARNVLPPIDPTIVGIPYLNQDALDLLSNCCTSKESDMWLSLGPNWTQTIDPMILKAARLPSSFQPIFSDGWAPVINELELIGLVLPPSTAGSLVGSGVGGVTASEGHRRHHSSKQQLLPQQPPFESEDLEPNALLDDSPGQLDNGWLESSHVHHRSQKSLNSKRMGAAELNSSPAHARSQNDLLVGSEPYFEPLPPPQAVVYGDRDRSSHYDSAGHRVSSASASQLPMRGGGNRSAMPPEINPVADQYPPGSRRNKHNSRGRVAAAVLDDYPMPPIHPMNPGRGDEFDLDYMNRGISGYPSDDYSKLHNQHLDDMSMPGRSTNRSAAAGPSSRALQQQQRLQKAHNQSSSRHQQDAMWRPTQPLMLDNHQSQRMEKFDYHRAVDGSYPFDSDTMSEHEREAMLLDLGPAQAEWYFELQSRGALTVRVLFTREANNDKELSVRRGEILEVLDDSRKWWRARNINLQVAHVPHTIVAVMNGYQTIDELLTHNPISLAASDPSYMSAPAVPQQRGPRRGEGIQQPPPVQYYPHHKNAEMVYDDRRNSKTAGAFRYF